MKKFTGVLAVSLVAVLAVSNARADLASTTYVTDAIAGKQAISNMVTDTEYGDATKQPNNYPNMPVAFQIAQDVVSGMAGGKVDKVNSGQANKVMTTNDSGTVTFASSITQAQVSGLTAALNDKAATSVTDGLNTRLTTAEGKVTALESGLDNTISDKIDSALGTGGAITAALAPYAKSADVTTEINAAKTAAINAAASDATAKANKAKTDAIAAAQEYADGLAGDYATKAQGLKADSALQKSGTLTAGNLLTTDASGNIIDAGKKGALASLDAVGSAQITNGSIAKEDLATAVQASLDMADNAVQTSEFESFKTTNTAAITAAADAAKQGAITELSTVYELPTLGTTLAGKQAKLTTGTNGNIEGTGSVTVSVDNNGKVTINGTDTTYTLPTASASVLGGVKTGTNITNTSGTISVADASASVKGVAKLYANVNDANTDGSVTQKVIKEELAKLIPSPTETAGTGTGGTLVLTYNPTTGNYAWESIGR